MTEISHSNIHRDILFGQSRPDLLRCEVLSDLFETTARSVPQKVALIYGDQQLTYAELDQKADQVAAHLINAGVMPGQIIGLFLSRGIDLLLMQMGITKTGAAWLPFDADTPSIRINVCLDDAKACGIVSSMALSDQLQACGCTVWIAESMLSVTASVPRLSSARRAEPTDPAYVIYTSGSTGKPKGIAISQGSICHFLRSENAILGVRGEDRVYQGFSVAFDMSFEEIWISYLVGATLWIAAKEIATDPEALPRALADNHVTVLHAVPTLLALFDQDVPSLRLINLGGEMCPQSLVARWARSGRKLFNTYGPTEATVSASLMELHPDERVTIGLPMPNYGLLVIDPALEQGLALMPRGETGELCITGPGVATGYLGRPELTREKFLANPWSCSSTDGRLYRTGDLARIAPDGLVECLGRTDDQVKIRGFRVELSEIETVLAGQPEVATAAVVLRREEDSDQLVAFIVAKSGAAISGSALRRALGESLPPYMVPALFQALEQMPRLPSGKIDRNALKALPLSGLAGDAATSDTPETPAEKMLFAILEKLFPGQPILRSADFFSDLGGHSLFAARLASALRADSRFAHITVRDIYQKRTIGCIAEVLSTVPLGAEAVFCAWTPPSGWRRWRCGVGQAAALPLLIALRMAQWLVPFFVYHFYTGDPGDSVMLAVALSVGAYVAATVSELAIAIAAKWLIVGRLKSGRYPLWGLMYYRWWLSDRLLEAAPVYLLSGSSLYTWWLRALGAKVGKDVIIGSLALRVPDLLSLGDGVSIGNAVRFDNARVEHGELLIGAIRVQREACIGSYAVLEGDTSVGTFGHLEGQSALGEGTHIPDARVWSGSPARDTGAFDPQSNRQRQPVSRRREIGEALFYSFGALLVATLFFLPVFPTFMLIDSIDTREYFSWLEGNGVAVDLARYFVLAFPAAAALIVCTALISSGIRWTVLPRLKPGTWSVHSKLYYSKWLVSQIQESSLYVLHGVFATVYAPVWYRLLGAKVGRNAEISSAMGLVPDMLELGDESFIADAVMLGDERIDGGWMTIQPTVISRRGFVGNGAYIPDGTTLPENVLIGVQSTAPPNDRIASGDTWLGSPPIRLPARERAQGFADDLTFHPSLARRYCRGLVEAFRIVAPHAIVIAVGYTVVNTLMPVAEAGQWLDVMLYLSIVGLLYGVGGYLFVACLKWVLIRRYRKLSVPMWTPFVWLSEAVTNLYEGIVVPNFMRYLQGSPWLPVALNLLGAKIGRGVYLDTTDLTEFDCVSIGDHSELNGLACPQTHLFEDRVMKIDHVSIGRRVTMRSRSLVLYSAVIGDDARLGPLTLVMKGEFIPPRTSWTGSPAAPWREPVQAG